jgi:putative zinc finger protein
MCNADKTDLVSYLYDDLDAAARERLERHLRGCADCSEELAGLRAVRTDLLAWTPPEPEFAFRIVAEPRVSQAGHDRRGGTVLTPDVPSWRAWLKPASGLAAAAVLVLAAAAGLARIEVHNGPDGWTLRTGAAAADASFDATRTAALAAHDIYLPDDGAFAVLERRIAALEASSRDTSGVRNASLVGARPSNEEVLKVVRELLAQSETRQKGELALRIAQVIRDIDAQRVADLNRVQQGLGRIDATVADEAQAHRELMNYILTSNSKMK